MFDSSLAYFCAGDNNNIFASMDEHFENFHDELTLALRTCNDPQSLKTALRHIWQSIEPRTLPRRSSPAQLGSQAMTAGTWISVEWLAQGEPTAWVHPDIWDNYMRPDLERLWTPDRLLRCKTGERADKIMPILRSWWFSTRTLPPDTIMANLELVWVNTFLWTALMPRNSSIFWEVYPVLHLGKTVFARLNRDGNLEPRGQAREVTLDSWEKTGSTCLARLITPAHPQALSFTFTWEEAQVILAFRHRTAQDHLLQVLARSEPASTPPSGRATSTRSSPGTSHSH